tara:strand:+ start:84 stop:746 length:663 start_codon:yes stop_codon:yes gene_type:complete
MKNLSHLEKIIDIKFKNKDLLIKSLTHKSFSSDKNNEKLEFLGDRVLGLVISKQLLMLYKNYSVGNLDKKLATLVNKKKCLEIGKKIYLQNFIIKVNSKNKPNTIENKIIADACEALIGAIYIEHGFEITEKFILKFWGEHFKGDIETQIDSKTKLQEFSLKKYKKLPIYKLISNTGPRHKPLFKIGVKLENSKFIYASGYSKKDAEQEAAKLYLKKIGL